VRRDALFYAVTLLQNNTIWAS